MNLAQRRFTQIGLIILAIILFAVSWKILPPDSYWLHYPYRIVMELSDGQEWGFESRFQELGLSVVLGFIMPLLSLGCMIFLQLGASRRIEK